MQITLSCVLVDGSTPVVATRAEQPVVWPEAEDGRLDFVVVNSAGQAVDISAGELRFGIRQYLADIAPLVAKVAILDGGGTGGLAHITMESARTLGLVRNRAYRYDVQLILANKRQQVIPTSTFTIATIVARP